MVGDRLVLTAAHCIANLDYPDKMRLVLGKVNLAARDRYERIYKPEKIVVHPEFRKGILIMILGVVCTKSNVHK